MGDLSTSAPLRVGTKLRVCLGCHFTGYLISVVAAPRCLSTLRLRRRHSLQNAGRLLASIVLLLPANLLPISIIYLNGGRQEDTILSDYVAGRSNNMRWNRIIIASILVPFTKVIVMFTLLFDIHFKCQQGLRTRILLLRMVTGLVTLVDVDLFVISIFNHVAD